MLDFLYLIIPINATEQEKFAVEETAFFLKEISATQSKIVADVDFNLNAPFISIGKTVQFKNQVGKCNLIEQVGEDGYRLLVKENCAFICGGASQGTVFGVYGFLKQLFNLVIFTETVYTYDSKPFEFTPIDIFEKPSLPMRALGIYPVHLEKRCDELGNKRYCYRLRLRQMDEGWGINNHCYFTVIPPSVYKEDHPEWFSENGKQLCLTNEELIAEYTKNMKKIIEDTPDDCLYMFGMQDTLEQCRCEKCKQLIDKYGFSTLTLIFCNTIAKRLNEWLKETYPERKVYFFTFAYVWAIEPPVKKIADGKYQPLCDLDIEDNLGVLIAPLYTSANYAWNDPRAKEALTTNYYEKQIPLVDICEGWRTVVKNIAVWSYNHNFADYMAPCPMWNGLEENFRYFEKLNAIHTFMEAGTDVQSNFAEMKIFVCSNLMWNTALEQDQLIAQFMSVYYEGAEQELYQYFKDIHKHADWMKQTFNRELIFVQFDDEPNGRYLDQRFWPKETLLKWLDAFNLMVKKPLSDQVRERVRLESLPVKFTLLYLYRKELDKAVALSLLDDVVDIAKVNGMNVAITEEVETFEAFKELWLKDLQ